MMLNKISPLIAPGLLLVSLAACATAPNPRWQWQRAETGLPHHAIILTVAAHPTDPNIIWAGYYDSGGLAITRDGGQTWTTGAAGLADNPVFDLLPLRNPAGNITLWAATRDGLLQSVNSGASWQPPPANLPAMAVFALAADARNRLYAGTDGAGIYFLENGGESWRQLAGDEPFGSMAVLSLDVSPDGQQLYAGTSGQGVIASRNGGRTWQATYPGEYSPALALNPNNPALAVASLRHRLVRTRDGGQSWHTIPLPWAEYNEIVSLLWLADGALGAGTSQGRLYRSLDGGDTWIEGGAGLPPGGVLALNVAAGSTAAKSGRLLAGTWTGVYGSRDGGQTWDYLTPSLGIPHAHTLLAIGDDLWLGARAGLFRWQPDSRQWAPTGNKLPTGIAALVADPTNPQTVYAGTLGSGMYRSVDGGATWDSLPTPVAGIPAIAVDPANTDQLYILAAWERVYESRDGGQSWIARWAGLGRTIETTSLTTDPLKPFVYVGTETGLYRSNNGGEWVQIAPELAGQSILALLARPNRNPLGNRTVLYIGATRGVYRSLDQGKTVQRSPVWGVGLENISVTDILADPHQPRRLYAGTAYAGVYQSVDNGQTWQPIGPAEITNSVVESMAWGPDGDLFVVTTTGVWRGTQVN